MDNLVFAPAHELAESIRARRVSAAEILDAHLAHIARHNPSLNAIVTLDEERARRRAQEADAALARGEVWGPLHGVPFTVKDAIETAGLRMTSGFPPLADYVPDRDAPVVARLREAGGILLGKTNLPILAEGAHTDNPLFGRTNNPWSLEHTPGGSTGGGAAALASGMSPLEIGSDAGGSIRIPAHFCGVFGLKPTDHRVPITGHIPPPPPLTAPQMLRHGAVLGPLARSVEDLSLALRLISGPDKQHREVPPVPVDPAPDRSLRSLRLAWTDDFGGIPVTGDTRKALVRLAGELDRLGCRIENRLPDSFDPLATLETFGELWQAEVGSALTEEVEAEQAQGFGNDPGDPFLRGMARRVNATMRQYTATLQQRDALIQAFEEFFEQWDALLCPVVVTPAFLHNAQGAYITVDDHTVPSSTGTMAYCAPFTVTGHPAVVVPFALSSGGLPIGVQIVGRLWGDMEVLSIAARLVEVTGPFQHPPGYGTAKSEAQSRRVERAGLT
jgi:amidase